MKVLIFTASAGNGHNSSANRIKEKLLELSPDTEVVVSDAFSKYALKIQQWAISKGYFIACENFTGIYNFFFEQQTNTDFSEKRVDKNFLQGSGILSGMLKEIYDFKPDVILSTYVFCTVALSNLKMAYDIPAKILALTLDYDVSPYWECCSYGTDCMFLTDEKMVPAFLEKGFCSKQLVVSGIPVSEKFSAVADKNELREKLGLEKDLFTVIVMKASFFPVQGSEIVRKFEKQDQRLQIIIINGKDEKDKKLIDGAIKRAKSKHNYVNLGYTDKIDQYFLASDLVFGKGGGLTTTEAVNAGLPSLIINRLPYQELRNCDVLVDNNCALVVTRKNFADEVTRLAQNEADYLKLVSGTKAFRKPQALGIICEKVLGYPLTVYDKEMTDTERQINKKVDKAYGEYLKDVKLKKFFISNLGNNKPKKKSIQKKAK